jgi:hypothetical protein
MAGAFQNSGNRYRIGEGGVGKRKGKSVAKDKKNLAEIPAR